MAKGWISVHRQIQNNWLWEDKPFSKGQAWIDILMLVNHEDGKTLMDGQLIDVYRGQHITSEPKLAERWGWSRTKVRNFLELLEKDCMIKNEKEGRKRTRLIVCNYNDYQVSENNTKTSKEQAKDKSKTSKEQVEDINNNDNNENNDNNDNNENKKERDKKIRYDEDSQYYQIALYIREKVLEVNPNKKVPNEDPEDMDKWSDDVRKIIELDKRTVDEFREVVKFVFNKSDFWDTVIQSPAGLRKNWDKIVPQMNRTVRPAKGKVIGFKEQMDVLEEWVNDG